MATESTTAWASIGDLIDALSEGIVPIGLGDAKPTPAAVHGAKVALRLLRAEGGALSPPPAVLTMPWGSVVFWWRTAPQRRIEVVSRNDAFEIVDTPKGPRFRQFMRAPHRGIRVAAFEADSDLDSDPSWVACFASPSNNPTPGRCSPRWCDGAIFAKE